MTERPSRTAEIVALARAIEQLRPRGERIVDDPHAERFLGPVARAALAAFGTTGRLGRFAADLAPSVLTFSLARHRLIDDRLRAACRAAAEGAPAPEQVLLLGAGYDSRPWRLAEELAGRVVWEVDHPATAEARARGAGRIDAPAAPRRAVTVDFQREDLGARLDAGGFPAGRPTFVTWEGVTMYLTREAVKATLETVRARVAAGSLLALDFWYLLDRPDPIATAHRMSPGLLHLLGEPILMGIHPEDVGPFLARHGWHLQALYQAEDLRREVAGGRACYPACYVVMARAGGRLG